MTTAKFEELVGKTLVSVEKVASDRIEFVTDTGDKYAMFHNQDCCENVNIEDICGELSDLVGTPILIAYESESDKDPEGDTVPDYPDSSFTWTFYNISTMKGAVTMRWYGESNGYYSESVDFEKV